MFASKIHRYIAREVLSPTLLCIVIFTLVMVMGQAVKLVGLVINNGVAVKDILYLLATLLPTFFAISCPLSFLMGIMIGLGRMSTDSEIVAIKSAGIGLAEISRPVFTLALFFVLLTGGLNHWAKSWGYNAFETRSFEIARQKMTIGLQPRVFMKQFENLVLYANDIDERSGQMRGLFVVEKKPDATAWVFADEGDILTDEKSATLTIRLRYGVIHRQQAGSPDSYQLIHFRNYDVQPETSLIGTESTRKRIKPKEIPTDELWQAIGRDEDLEKVREMQAELHLRLASTVAPLLFVLFGLPFSIQSHRSGRSGGFVMGLIIFLGYYFTLSTALTLTKDAGVPPWLSFWVPHLALAAGGIFFLRLSSQERSNPLVSWIDQVIITVQKRVRKNVDA